MAAAETILLPDCKFCPDKRLNLSTLSSGLTPQITCCMSEFLIRASSVVWLPRGSLRGWTATIQHHESPDREAGEKQVWANLIHWFPLCSAGAETAYSVVCEPVQQTNSSVFGPSSLFLSLLSRIIEGGKTYCSLHVLQPIVFLIFVPKNAATFINTTAQYDFHKKGNEMQFPAV